MNGERWNILEVPTVQGTKTYGNENDSQRRTKDGVCSTSQILDAPPVAKEKGETKTVTFTIDENLLRFYNADLKYASEKGNFQLYIGSNAAVENGFSFQLK